MYTYKTEGVCPRSISFNLDGDVVSDIKFEGGCNGNLKAVSRLLEGKTISEIVSQLEGVTCGRKSTSCSDQLVQGLKAFQTNKSSDYL